MKYFIKLFIFLALTQNALAQDLFQFPANNWGEIEIPHEEIKRYYSMAPENILNDMRAKYDLVIIILDGQMSTVDKEIIEFYKNFSEDKEKDFSGGYYISPGEFTYQNGELSQRPLSDRHLIILKDSDVAKNPDVIVHEFLHFWQGLKREKKLISNSIHYKDFIREQTNALSQKLNSQMSKSKSDPAFLKYAATLIQSLYLYEYEEMTIEKALYPYSQDNSYLNYNREKALTKIAAIETFSFWNSSNKNLDNYTETQNLISQAKMLFDENLLVQVTTLRCGLLGLTLSVPEMFKDTELTDNQRSSFMSNTNRLKIAEKSSSIPLNQLINQRLQSQLDYVSHTFFAPFGLFGIRENEPLFYRLLVDFQSSENIAFEYIQAKFNLEPTIVSKDIKGMLHINEEFEILQSFYREVCSNLDRNSPFQNIEIVESFNKKEESIKFEIKEEPILEIVLKSPTIPKKNPQVKKATIPPPKINIMDVIKKNPNFLPSSQISAGVKH
ncbi:MAG: hypothetical protein KBD63_04430 [Bacteriovoracaceae bacterium]|nr:hypothetical protein [Bacteriovoracaceae bacterium]